MKRRIFIIIGIVILLAPLGKMGAVYLENYFPRLETFPKEAKGIILLGGNFNLDLSYQRGFPCYNIAAGRLIEFIEIASQHPHLPLVFTGGGIRQNNADSEALMTQRILQNIGFDLSRIQFEFKSSNTYENAKLTFDMLHPKPDEKWVLVTSAIHMPRAVALFRALGWNIIPSPVNYHTDGKMNYKINFNLLDILHYWAYACHEWKGLIEVYVRGNSQTLLPRIIQ